MAIFNSYVKLPEGRGCFLLFFCLHLWYAFFVWGFHFAFCICILLYFFSPVDLILLCGFVLLLTICVWWMFFASWIWVLFCFFLFWAWYALTSLRAWDNFGFDQTCGNLQKATLRRYTVDPHLSCLSANNPCPNLLRVDARIHHKARKLRYV